MNTSFLLGGLTGIAVTIAFEWLIATMFALPRDGVEVDVPGGTIGIDDDAVPASEVVERFTDHVHLVPPADVIDLREQDAIRRERWSETPPDAGHVTIGQALGVVVVLAALVLLLGLVGAVETAGLS